MICRDSPTHGWRCVGGWVGQWVQWVRSGQITNYLINLDIIEIIQFCLKICDLLRHPHLYVCVLVVGSMDGLMGRLCQITSN